MFKTNFIFRQQKTGRQPKMSGWIQATMQPAMQPNTEVGFWGKFGFSSQTTFTRRGG